MKIFVTGATGFVGRHLIRALVHSGHEITCLVRKKDRAKKILGTSVEFVEGDLNGSASNYISALHSAEVIYHLAACVDSSKVSDFYEINFEGTKRLIDIAKKSKMLSKLIFLSSIAVVGRNHRSVITEDVKCRPFSPYGKSKLKAEQIVAESVFHSDNLQIYIVRSPVVYGEDQPPILSDFLNKIRCTKLTLPGNGSNKRSMCYIGNLIFALCSFLNHHTAGVEIVNVADSERKTLAEVIQVIANTMGKEKVDITWLPFFVSSVILFIYKAMALIGYNSLTFFTIGTATANIDCETEKLKRIIGLPLPYSLFEGMAKTVKWLQFNRRV